MLDKAAILAQFAFYTQAPPQFQAALAAAARPVRLEPGTAFYREGLACDVFALVGAGELRVFKRAETGRELTLYRVQAGQTCLVNMLCAFLDSPAPATAVVEQPVAALAVPGATFRAWVEQSDVLRRHVFSAMAGRLTDLMTLVEEVAFRRMDERLAGFLLRRFAGQAPPAAITTTHVELAADLGTAREVVSRLLKDLEHAGAVQMARGRIVLRDAAVLERLAAPAAGVLGG